MPPAFPPRRSSDLIVPPAISRARTRNAARQKIPGAEGVELQVGADRCGKPVWRGAGVAEFSHRVGSPTVCSHAALERARMGASSGYDIDNKGGVHVECDTDTARQRA